MHVSRLILFSGHQFLLRLLWLQNCNQRQRVVAERAATDRTGVPEVRVLMGVPWIGDPGKEWKALL